MDRRFLTVLGVSLVFAIVVSSIFYQFQARSSGAEAATPPDEVDVVVATRPLGVGVMIKPADVKLVKIASVAFPKGAFSKVEEVLDRPVVSNILLDEPILEGRLALKGSGLGLAPAIPVGMRAVTVRVNDVAGVAGFVMPGMRVDVLVTGRPPRGDEEPMTNTVLQNLLVLSAGQQMQADARGEAIQTPTVTLLADPDQAETLTLANTEGKIQLVLRNSTDQQVAKTDGSRVMELYGVKSAPPAPRPAPKAAPAPKPAPVVVTAPPPPPPLPPPPPPPQVVVFRGNKRTVEVVSAAPEN
jgi:pilus assembly protein CpaB